MPVKSNLSSIGAQLRSVSTTKGDIPSVQPSAPEPATLGRKKKLTTKRTNAITAYLTDDMMAAIEEIKYNNRVEKLRVIQTAIYEFLENHYNKETKSLDTDGFNKVREFESNIQI